MMIMPTRCWTLRLMMMFLIVFGTAACASYPNEPRKPQANDDTYEASEDTMLAVAVKDGILANDLAREGTTLTLLETGEITTDGGGIIILDADGSFTYDPEEDFSGTDQLEYTVENEKGKRNQGIITFNVGGANDTPLPEDDTAQTNPGQTVTINVLENDVDPDGDELQVVSITEPSVGTARINADNTITYIPPATHSGDVTIDYTVSDAQSDAEEGLEASARINITISSAGTGIALEPDDFVMNEDGTLTRYTSVLLDNDTVTATAAPLTLLELGEAQNGTVVLNDDDTFTYSPNPDYSGRDTFTYTVQSAEGNTASSTVTVTIVAQNDAPTISQIGDVTITAGQRTGFIGFTIEDPDTLIANLSLDVQALEQNPANLLPSDPFTLFGSGETRALRIQTRANMAGTATIGVTVSELIGDDPLETTVSFVLTVTIPSTSTDTATGTGTATDTDDGTDDTSDDDSDDTSDDGSDDGTTDDGTTDDGTTDDGTTDDGTTDDGTTDDGTTDDGTTDDGTTDDGTTDDATDRTTDGGTEGEVSTDASGASSAANPASSLSSLN